MLLNGYRKCGKSTRWAWVAKLKAFLFAEIH